MLLKNGKKWWNKRLREAVEDLKVAFNYDRLFIGGGASKFIRFELPEGVKSVSKARVGEDFRVVAENQTRAGP